MAEFVEHNEDTAPAESIAILSDTQKTIGFIPNLHAVMSEAPGLLASYKFVHEQFVNSSFNAEELTVVWQSINVEHNCHYCVPAHSAIAKSMKVSPLITEALRNESPLPSDRLETLRSFTLSVVRNRGKLSDEEVQAFLDAGYTKRQVLEVVLGLAQKVMSNYTNHFADTKIDPAFKEYAWRKML